MKNLVFTTFCIALIWMGCTKSDKNNTDEDIQAISAVSADIVKAWNNGNYEAFIGHIDNDAIIMPPNAPSIVGIDAIKSQYSNYFKSSSYKVNETLDEVVVCGDYGYVNYTWIGSMKPVDASEPITFNNKALGIYKRQPDGRWLVYRNMFNSNEILEAVKSPEHSE